MNLLCRLTFLIVLCPLALAGGWEKLGSREVTFQAERDTISVTIMEGTFKQIKLMVRKNGVRFLDMKVHFANGQTQDVELRAFIPAGGETRVIDLSGRKRIIKKVTFAYKSQGKARGRKLKRATVVLWGKH